MNSNMYSYPLIDSKELEIFLDVLDFEKTGEISLGDIECICTSLSLNDIYQNVKQCFKDIKSDISATIDRNKLRDYLSNNKKSSVEEIHELFSYIDYDHKNEINKNKLKIIVNELMGENLTEEEALDMIKIMGKNTISKSEFETIFE